ncbi:peptide chain release factor N(5)-glutamine methyltransferase [Paracoccus aerodenitrificans]|uniref:peptide chain release factor N(5)-glutamine methyltransferase n=1 Tax=Paracoccus aerodenitrificans TaxID=3017781 RepID=UPI0022F0C6FC|nr:peptide chain release factor N(5)-glutamine methyltransferase [Paracoccus aerodenitrificans]WBU64160.1 peptide chain release factor N(5)-glutamine methyltransferase [Paracoccus aerodenitrificans]
MLTGRELRREAQRRFEAASIPDAATDAARLFGHALSIALGKPVQHHHIALYLNETASAELVSAMAPLVEARLARRPVSQIIGRRAFWKHDFRVTSDTLDPRPETETLIEAALRLPWETLLDLGTGTGAILISLLDERRGASGRGCDISDAALAVARENAARIGVEAALMVSDWFSEVRGRFDLIVSNPPYIAVSEMQDLAPELREWEPRMALTDEGDGLSAYRRIAADAPRFLNPGGHVLVEIGSGQGEAVQKIFSEAGAETKIISDLDGRDRVVLAKFRDMKG